MPAKTKRQTGQKTGVSKGARAVFAVVTYCDMLASPQPVREYQFAPGRKWRFDLAWPALKLAVEFEGGVWTGGRHTRGAGFSNDIEKYNTAALLGWRVIRCTYRQLQQGLLWKWLDQAFTN